MIESNIRKRGWRMRKDVWLPRSIPAQSATLRGSKTIHKSNNILSIRKGLYYYPIQPRHFIFIISHSPVQKQSVQPRSDVLVHPVLVVLEILNHRQVAVLVGGDFGAELINANVECGIVGTTDCRSLPGFFGREFVRRKAG